MAKFRQSKSKRVCGVNLDRRSYPQLDYLAARMKMTRSAVIRAAVEAYLAKVQLTLPTRARPVEEAGAGVGSHAEAAVA